jgi:hypothetical protein
LLIGGGKGGLGYDLNESFVVVFNVLSGPGIFSAAEAQKFLFADIPPAPDLGDDLIFNCRILLRIEWTSPIRDQGLIKT